MRFEALLKRIAKMEPRPRYLVAMSEEELDADIARIRFLLAKSKKRAEEQVRLDAQTICDGCGCDLHGNAWYSYKGGTMQKLCKTCIGL
jgi:hypothetical protein